MNIKSMNIHSKNVNRVLYYTAVIISASTMLLLVLNVFYFEVPFGNNVNIGLLLSYISAMFLAISQFLEWKRKHNQDNNTELNKTWNTGFSHVRYF